METININGKTFVPLDEVRKRIFADVTKCASKTLDELDEVRKRIFAEEEQGMRYCMVRTYSAGVFAGYIAERNGKEVTLKQARRIWYWDGAATLSQLATEGTSKPEKCKFPCPVPEVILTEVIEIIPITEEAAKSIAEVPEWTAF